MNQATKSWLELLTLVRTVLSLHPPGGIFSQNVKATITSSASSVERLHVGDLHAVGWGEGPRASETPVKATP